MAYFIWLESSLSLLSTKGSLIYLSHSQFEIWAFHEKKVIAESLLHSLPFVHFVGWTLCTSFHLWRAWIGQYWDVLEVAKCKSLMDDLVSLLLLCDFMLESFVHSIWSWSSWAPWAFMGHPLSKSRPCALRMVSIFGLLQSQWAMEVDKGSFCNFSLHLDFHFHS